MQIYIFNSFSSKALLEHAKNYLLIYYILISKTKDSFSQGAVSELLLSNSTQTNSAWREDLETGILSENVSDCYSRNGSWEHILQQLNSMNIIGMSRIYVENAVR